MVKVAPVLTAFVAALLFGQSVAHPGHSVEHEIEERSAYLKHAKKDLSHCQAKLAARGVQARAIERRSATVSELRDVVKRKKAKREQQKQQQQQQRKKKVKTHGGKQTGSGRPGEGQKQSKQATSSRTSEFSTSTVRKGASGKTSTTSAASLTIASSSVVANVATSVSSIASAASAAVGSASGAASSGALGTAGGALPSGSAGGAAPSGGAGGAMPSGGTGGGNGTGDAGQTASSISTFGQQVVNTSHLSSLDVTPSTSGVEDIIFSNRSCVLNPEGEIGPFWVSGEYIREDVVDSQEGVPLYIDGQFIDVSTCEPIEDLYWDVWHCNSTGVYSGVIGNGNGNSADTSNLNNTFLRGLQPTDSDGVATFQSIFPGHYAGRATHIHVVSHIGGTVLSNGTYVGGNVTHIGQLFFDQDLITEVNTYSPYSTNTIAITENDVDRVFAEETLSDSDPVFDYVLLGDDVSDGLFAWVSIGVDTSEEYATSAAAAYGEDGGVVE